MPTRLVGTAVPVQSNEGGTGYITYNDGEILIGDTVTHNLVKGTLTVSSGLLMTLGPGSITLNASGALVVNAQSFTTPGTTTWNKPARGTFARIICIGSGAGGASGRRGAGVNGASGGGGGAGGCYTDVIVPFAALGATETVVVGAGGVGGLAQTVNDTDGNVGDNGSLSRFGVWARAYGGNSGPGGMDALTTIGGSANIVGLWIGADGADGKSSSIPGAFTDTHLGAGGGGGGGGNDGVGGSYNGGTNNGPLALNGPTPTAGVAPGGNGGNGNAPGLGLPGTGGAGGAGGDGATNGGNGGNGGLYGGGGGGGGGSLNGFNSGAGGNGADGLVLVYVY